MKQTPGRTRGGRPSGVTAWLWPVVVPLLAAVLLLAGGSPISARAAALNPGDGASSTVSASVKVLNSDGSPSKDQTGATEGQILVYTLTYQLAGSVNLLGIKLIDTVDVISDGYGSLVPGSIQASATTDPESLVTTPPNFSNANVSVLTDPGSLTVSIAADESVGRYSGIADGDYTITWQVAVNTVPDKGIKNLRNHVETTVLDLDGSAVTDKVPSGDPTAPINLIGNDNHCSGPDCPTPPCTGSQCPCTGPNCPVPPKTCPADSSKEDCPGGGGTNNPGGSNGGSGPGEIAHTGAAVAGIGIVATGLIGLGFFLILGRRRRQEEDVQVTEISASRAEAEHA